MQVEALEAKAEDAAQFLKMIASPPRLLLLCHMAERECSVGELAERTGMRMPTVSQQLSLLRAQGLVNTRRDGTTIYYRLNSDAARDVMDVLFRHFCSDTMAGADPRLVADEAIKDAAQ
ncbi:ArsR/SmtB family transcription factor [Polymorphum gilvum]|uniref:ArsR family transcriptional regulator n=1 Tax=Polymorphum gilvum (strain LMG 25793 / CGMCC 1.9160 / SL003B-26A1) TaxID=991905 RepID=F2J5A5_POLGS|nr:metalloregulator ArsR/SmtB family transcription factor [Polymorphum gilvum]ADZ71164.1 ArsR family transcriptional regulator [Polymorphum gilvum SL003B-26A1]